MCCVYELGTTMITCEQSPLYCVHKCMYVHCGIGKEGGTMSALSSHKLNARVCILTCTCTCAHMV